MTRLDAIEQRMMRLERQNRVLKGVAGLACLTICVGLLLGAAAGLKDGVFGTITAEKIVLVDADGDEIILLGRGEVGTGILINDGEGRKAVGLGVSNEDQTGGLAVFDTEGRGRIGLGMEAGVPSLAVASAAGRKLVALGGNADRYGVAVLDEKEVQRAGFGMTEDGPICYLLDESGTPRVGMSQSEQGEYHFLTVDDKGSEHWVR